jgi:hypothetical protein
MLKEEKSMAKVIQVLCDVKPCTSQAGREFEVNGKTLYVCGEQCFTKFWSREYGDWKQSPYKMEIVFPNLKPTHEYVVRDFSDTKNSIEIFGSDLRIVKPSNTTRIN